MRTITRFLLTFAAVTLVATSAMAQSKAPLDPKKVLAQPKAFVGSEVCKTCHLEHYDAWKKTIHSRMLQNAKTNADAIIVDIDEKTIRTDLAKKEAKLKVPSAKIYVPKVGEIEYTIGSQWKQRYLIKKGKEYYISPIQYNVNSGVWTNYHEHDWEKRPWLKKCGGCHATGVDLEQGTFKEPGVACEACHGAGSHHSALPRSAIFQKRATIINPAKLTRGVAVQICGSCHNRGKATKHKGAGWPVGYKPGKALESYYTSVSYATDKKHVYPNELSKGHHQQYIDWKQSSHAREGVTCVSCHSVHQLGGLVNRGQTRGGAGSNQCLSCHEPQNKVGAHAVHAFGNCIGCHMPRIAKSSESGDIRSHVFKVLLPKVTIENPKIPNSCTTCHKHKNEDLADLQKRFDTLVKQSRMQGAAIKAGQ